EIVYKCLIRRDRLRRAPRAFDGGRASRPSRRAGTLASPFFTDHVHQAARCTKWSAVVERDGHSVGRQIDGALLLAVEHKLHRVRQRDALILRGVVHEYEYLLARTNAAADLDAVRHGTEHGRHGRFLRHPLSGCGHQLVIELRSDIGDVSLAVSAGDHGGLIVEPSVALAVLQQNFVPGREALQLLRPDAGLTAAPRTCNRKIFFERIVLFDARAQRIHEESRLSLWK